MLSNLKKGTDLDVPDLTSPSDETLVLRAQRDDRGAMEELVKRYQSKAFSIAYHMGSGDIEEAKDFTQEAFLKAFRNIKRFRKKSSFYTWFYRIIVNTCLDGRRRRQRREKYFFFLRPKAGDGRSSKDLLEEQAESGTKDDPLAVLSDKNFRHETRRAMMSLSEKQRLVFQLKAIQGMSTHEVAQVTGMAEGTVKSHLFRATQSLREALQEWAEP
jgi:RNA polymerase sigma-70 factor (ECF subfamily)